MCQGEIAISSAARKAVLRFMIFLVSKNKPTTPNTPQKEAAILTPHSFNPKIPIKGTTEYIKREVLYSARDLINMGQELPDRSLPVLSSE